MMRKQNANMRNRKKSKISRKEIHANKKKTRSRKRRKTKTLMKNSWSQLNSGNANGDQDTPERNN